MKIASNTGADRVIDLLRPLLNPGNQLGMVTPTFALFAFAAVLEDFARLAETRMVLPLENSEATISTAADHSLSVSRLLSPTHPSGAVVTAPTL